MFGCCDVHVATLIWKSAIRSFGLVWFGELLVGLVLSFAVLMSASPFLCCVGMRGSSERMEAELMYF